MHHVEAHVRANAQDRRGKHKISGEQGQYEICGRERDGARVNMVILQGLSGRKTENLKEVGSGLINRGSKDQDFGRGKI